MGLPTNSPSDQAEIKQQLITNLLTYAKDQTERLPTANSSEAMVALENITRACNSLRLLE